MVQIGINSLKLIEVISLPDVLNMPRFHGKYNMKFQSYYVYLSTQNDREGGSGYLHHIRH